MKKMDILLLNGIMKYQDFALMEMGLQLTSVDITVTRLR